MRVLCTSPNASELISGVPFTKTERGMVSEEIDEDVAKGFLAIPGYEVHSGPPPVKEASGDGEADPQPESAGRRGRARTKQ